MKQKSRKTASLESLSAPVPTLPSAAHATPGAVSRNGHPSRHGKHVRTIALSTEHHAELRALSGRLDRTVHDIITEGIALVLHKYRPGVATPAPAPARSRR